LGLNDLIRILLLGKYGQLGWECHRALCPLGEIKALDYPEIDLNQPESLRDLIRSWKPELIVNATAYTAVDRAENEAKIAFSINCDAPRILAEEAQQLGCGLIHYSTDYVFDGTKGTDYVETDIPNPINIYGQSKLAGERAIQKVGGAYLILRTSWVYSLRRDSFVTKVLEWAREQTALRIVCDQVGNPTWSRMLAEATAQLLAKGAGDLLPWLDERSGIFHLAGSGAASRLEWAQAVLDCDPRKDEQIALEVQPARSTDFPTPAQRPLYSALSCDLFNETFGLQLPDWRQALQLVLEAA
jgi:dTDP-4-dehydrorhamnose reductase